MNRTKWVAVGAVVGLAVGVGGCGLLPSSVKSLQRDMKASAARSKPARSSSTSTRPISATGKQRAEDIRKILATIEQRSEWTEGKWQDREVVAKAAIENDRKFDKIERFWRMMGSDQRTAEGKALRAEIDAAHAWHGKVGDALAKSAPPGAAPGELSRAGAHYLKMIEANLDDESGDHPLCKGTYGLDQRDDGIRMRDWYSAKVRQLTSAARPLSPADRANPQVKAQLDRVEGMRQCVATLAARDKVLAVEAEKDKERQLGMYRKWLAFAPKYKQVLWDFYIALNKIRGGNAPHCGGKMKECLDQMEEVAKFCETELPGIRNPKSFADEPERAPGDMCRAARDRLVVAKSVAERAGESQLRWLERNVESQLKSFDGTHDEVPVGLYDRAVTNVQQAVDEELAKWKSHYVPGLVEPDPKKAEAAAEKIRTMLTNLGKQLEKMQPFATDKTASDGKHKAMVVKRVKDQLGVAKIRSVGFEPNWREKRTIRGVPIERDRTAVVTFQDPKTKLCHAAYVTVHQPGQGKGWGRPCLGWEIQCGNDVGDNIIRCK